MKKQIIAGVLSLFSFFAVSQQNGGGAISYLPFQASDYLILDAVNNPDVTHWNIEILEKFITPTGAIDYRLIDQIEIFGTYFVKIIPEYTQSDYYIKVTGLNSANEVEIIEGPVLDCPPGGCGGGQGCGTSCIASTYAWTAWYTANDAGGDIALTIVSAGNPITYDPYYQYFSPSQFDQLGGTGADENYYGVSAFNLFQANKIIKLTGVTAPLFDASGNALVGTVYGVQKWYGPWANLGVLQATNITANYADLCNENGEGVFTAVSIINNNSTSSLPDGAPAFACNGNTIGDIGGAGPVTHAELFHVDCYEEVSSEFADVNGNMYTTVQLIDCFQSNQGGFNWPDGVAVINIMSYNNTDGEIITIRELDMFSPNGEFIAPPIILEKGLYTFGIQFDDASYTTIFFESREPSTSTFALSNFLTATAFPVPIVDDEFSLRLEASAKLKFLYVLSDLNGNELYRKNFVIQKDHNLVHKIKVHDGIPSGHLSNKFIFEDGSQLVFQTIK